VIATSLGTTSAYVRVVLLCSAWTSSRRRGAPPPDQPDDPRVVRLRLAGSCPSPQGLKHYKVSGVKTGFSLMLVAGTLSGLLGITAAASAGVYLNRGYIDPGLTMPVVLGVLGGSGGGDAGRRDDLQRPDGEAVMATPRERAPLSDRQVDEIIGALLR
jgi:hypothetical protein